MKVHSFSPRSHSVDLPVSAPAGKPTSIVLVTIMVFDDHPKCLVSIVGLRLRLRLRAGVRLTLRLRLSVSVP